MKIFVNAFLENNLGDDLFVDILLNRYPQHAFYAISKDFKPRKNLKVLSNNFLIRVIRKLSLKPILANKCDMSVVIGGSMYMEETSQDTNKRFSLGRNPYYILGVNFGPYKTEKYYQNVHDFFSKAQDVCFREEYSYNLFKDLPNVRCAPDIVLSMDTSKIYVTNKKRVIFSIISCKRKINEKYEEQYQDTIIEMTKFFIEKEYEICYMSFCKDEGDERAIEEILSKTDENIKDKIATYYYRGNIEEALEQLANSQIIVGSRFHANILGMIFGKTIIPMAYSDKTKNVLEDLHFKGPIIDIKNLKQFNVKKDLTDEILNYKIDISETKKQAEEHFRKLDELLKKERE